MSLNIYMQFLKWRVVSNSLLGVRKNEKIWKSLFYGFSAGIITPVRVGEYLGRKLAFEDVGLLKVTIATIIEKFASLFIVLFVGCLASTLFLSIYYSFLYSIPIILLFFVILTFLILFFKGYMFSSNLFNNLADKFDFINNIKIELMYFREINSKSIKLLINTNFFYLC